MKTQRGCLNRILYALVDTVSYVVVGNRDCTASNKEMIVNNDCKDLDGNSRGII
jgi:hypothetical protein